MTAGQPPAARNVLSALFAVAALSVLAYFPSLQLPFISDDYIQIDLARNYGPPAGWWDLFHDALYRCRATSLLLTHWTEQIFGLDPLPFRLTSLAIHIFNAGLIFALGCWPLIGWRVSAAAACFFAVYEGHQEAVIWYAALPELLVFSFSLLCCLAWVRWIGSNRPLWWAASLGAFLLALLSKESAVALTPVLAAMLWIEGKSWRAIGAAVAPFAVLSASYFALAYLSRSNHLHFNDGTFSLHAPFWVPWTRSIGRLFWFWGAASLILLWRWRDAGLARPLKFAAFWIAFMLLPYCFLTYMPRVPSRHTYLSAIGVALIAGAAFTAVASRSGRARPWVVPALGACVVAHNCGYLWFVKHRQYVERAAPTEELVRQAQQTTGPIPLDCFPYSRFVADATLRVRLGSFQPARWESAGRCGAKAPAAGLD